MFNHKNYKTMKRQFSIILLALLPIVASAFSEVDNYEVPGYDAKVDGFYYKFPSSSGDEALVSYVKYHVLTYYNQNHEYFDASTYYSNYSGDVVIPESFTYEGKTYRVTGINECAFYDCKGLTSITIPRSVTKIGKDFIKGCSGLTDIYCLSEEAPEATNAFSYTSISNITLHVPEGSEESYKAHTPWCFFFGVNPTGSIEINSINFPDHGFRSWLLQSSIGSDGVLTEAEMASVKTMELLYGEYYPLGLTETIVSLKGIEYFTELTKLRFEGIDLKELDMTKNPKLEVLDGFTYTLKKLNVSGCSKLKELNCSDNPLTELDVSGCTSLTTLNCNNLRLIGLNASGCTSLTKLECEDNSLTMLDVTGCTALTYLKFWKNKIKGAGMDAMIESLPVTSEGTLYAYWNSGGVRCQNEMTTRHVAAAKAKGWAVRSYENKEMKDYAGIEPTVVITFTSGQMATIILPTAPDATKGKYYRLDGCEDEQIAFVEELQPQARTPYIIMPNQDFSIEVKEAELEGLSSESVTVDGISFVGTFRPTKVNCPDGCYIDILDTTPDCYGAASDMEMSSIGALRAYLIVKWDDPIDHGSPKSQPAEKMEIVLHDNGTGIESIQNSKFKVQNEDAAIYDFSGRRLSKPQRGVNIIEGRKLMVK